MLNYKLCMTILHMLRCIILKFQRALYCKCSKLDTHVNEVSLGISVVSQNEAAIKYFCLLIILVNNARIIWVSQYLLKPQIFLDSPHSHVCLIYYIYNTMHVETLK